MEDIQATPQYSISVEELIAERNNLEVSIAAYKKAKRDSKIAEYLWILSAILFVVSMIFIISEKGEREQINEVEKLEILAHIGRRTSCLLGRNKHCEPLRSIVTRDILGQLKHEYGCGLSELKKKYIADTHDFIDCYELPTIMKERYKL